jgi:chloramphenicol 3-O phosphotransferase
MTSGVVVILNGTSSSGKSTLAENVQKRFIAERSCWMVIALDDLFLKLPPEWITMRVHVGPFAEDGISFTHEDGEVVRRIGPVGQRVIDAYRGWVAAVARSGINVLVDEVLLSEHDCNGWQADLAGLDVLWVGVQLDQATTEERERARGDRMLGLARSQFDIIHRYADYDFTVDTGTLDSEAAADVVHAKVTEWLNNRRP